MWTHRIRDLYQTHKRPMLVMRSVSLCVRVSAAVCLLDNSCNYAVRHMLSTVLKTSKNQRLVES